jgi:3-hydroxyacyl-[acyl-carrier-protein] dehydratase
VHFAGFAIHSAGMDEILRTIPHRPPFLFIDEIVEIRADGATCKRTIRMEEPQFEGHYPGNPIMPGVLLCEACFQTGAIYLAKQIEKDGRSLNDVTPVLSRITDARFKQMVKPGDEITIEVTMKETISRFYFMKGKVLKGGKPALTIEFALAMVEAEAAK